ncbi:MAG: ribosomal RNA small subunit methyltransferase A [Bacilli bacterium]|nr:ribosomal RNA small subunit methyltransferase A [Bacilli bacterium]
MEEYNVKFKKKFGQNFLKDKSTIEKIVNTCKITKKDLVIEVGPGGGIPTKELAKLAKKVLSYEIDEDLKNELDNKLSDFSNVEVLYQDFLKSNIKKDIEKEQYDNIYFISNVPYYITTPIINKLTDSNINFKKITIMVQKEVADRLSSLPGNREYGSITVLLNYYYDIKKEFFVSREEFIPKPNVDSEVISLKEKKDKLYLKDKEYFKKIVRDSFQFKRKNIKNNLKKYNLDEVLRVLEKYNYDLSVRAEQLDYSIFIELSNELC